MSEICARSDQDSPVGLRKRDKTLLTVGARTCMLQVLRCLIFKPNAWPFLQPVDPVALSIPGMFLLASFWLRNMYNYALVGAATELGEADEHVACS